MMSVKIFDESTLQSDIVLDKTKLQRVTKTKFLGVIIDENLTWKCHISVISKTMARNIGVMNNVKYFTLLLPTVNYGILVWGSAFKICLEKHLKLKNCAIIRTILNNHY